MTRDQNTSSSANVAGHFVLPKPFSLRSLRGLLERVAAAARADYFPTHRVA